MVDDRIQAEVENVVRTRMLTNLPAIEYSIEQIRSGTPWRAEKSFTRSVMRLRKKSGLSSEAATSLVTAVDHKDRRDDAATLSEAVRGSIDFVGVNFLEKGRRVADAVGRVIFLNGNAQGSGFLVGPGLFITNNHVIESAVAAGGMCVQFDYEIEVSGEPRQPTSFMFDPARCFVTDGVKGLDFTLIAVGQKRSGPATVERYGFIPLSDASDKHMLGETANIIQHPEGRLKELVLRENQLVARDETEHVLHYVADTMQGSSGAPVFNNEWQVIALHHWGVPWRELLGKSGVPLAREVNEGIRASSIVKHLADLVGRADTPADVARVLALWSAAPESGGRNLGVAQPLDTVLQTQQVIPAAAMAGTRLNPDGSMTWTFPIEISVRAPLLAVPVLETTGQCQIKGDAAEAKLPQQEVFDDRIGFEANFIPGFVVPLPDYSRVTWRAARNQLAENADDPNELRYHHFSIVMNADRRVCGFTAVNIDGERLKAVNREDKTVTSEPTAKLLGVESFSDEGAEASDAFRPDPRILESEQMNRLFYEKQVVAGFPEAKSKERIARIFQKGHVVLRGDPAWGSDSDAVAAERDTFFYTNACPQVGFFNQGSALNKPGSKGKFRWRAVETFVLRNALTMRSRVSVFAGPVFAADDPMYRFGSRVALKFWKIAVWNEDGQLKSVALLADQSEVLTVMPESMGEEAFRDADELTRVREFLTTVQDIEDLTKLNFGSVVRNADIRRGESIQSMSSVEDAKTKKSKNSTLARQKKAVAKKPKHLGVIRK